jgi:hypothetical protein
MIRSVARLVLSFLILSCFSSGTHACGGIFDLLCNLRIGKQTSSPSPVDPGKTINIDVGKVGHAAESAAHDIGKTVEKAGRDTANTVVKAGIDGKTTAPAAKPLEPVRAYLNAKDIPPVGAGAYGLVVLQARPTPASRSKLMMVCRSFVAYFPRSETSDVPINDQMITVWPLEKPDAEEAKRDDCGYALDNYDLVASQAAIRDAHAQHADFEGEGPYLVGWSPSNSRVIPDALVLVVDLSADITQADIDHKFQFWKNEIVLDPSKWRRGFASERIRESIRKFADTYGQAMLDAIKLVGEKKS